MLQKLNLRLIKKANAQRSANAVAAGETLKPSVKAAVLKFNFKLSSIAKHHFFALRERHTFHLVTPSALPLITAFSVFSFVSGIVLYWNPSASAFINNLNFVYLEIGAVFFILSLYIWFATIIIEASNGDHTKRVRSGLRLGMTLFIVSEIMFFFAFFWGFFHFSLTPSILIGSVWPPVGTQSINIFGIPLLNSVILLSSGLFVTIAHKSLLSANTFTAHRRFRAMLGLTIIHGIVFLGCQWLEYTYGVFFSWTDNVYGSIFFVTTGFHGFHVTVGVLFLAFCFFRDLITIEMLRLTRPSDFCLKLLRSWNIVNYFIAFRNFLAKLCFTQRQHFGFEAAAWYWHFVDVVWLFLFLSVYWWGN